MCTIYKRIIANVYIIIIIYLERHKGIYTYL